MLRQPNENYISYLIYPSSCYGVVFENFLPTAFLATLNDKK